MKFKYLWLIMFGVPYVIWTFDTLRNMIYRKFFRKDVAFKYNQSENAWMTVHLIGFVILGLISFAVWLTGLWDAWDAALS